MELVLSKTAIEEFIGPFMLLWKLKLFTIAGVKLSLGNVLMALTFLLFATRISRMISRQINQRIILKFVEEKSSQNTYQTFAYYGSLASVIALSLTTAGIPLTIFTVVGGALAIGVGFGSQNIVSNFISGIIMLVEQPIKVGDIVEVDGMTGTVITIGTRSTKIRTAESKVYIVPNSFFLEKGVTNWNFENNVIRSTISFGVAYGTDTQKLKNVCMDILLNEEGIEKDPIPLVFFDDFGDNNLIFQLVFFCDTTKIETLGHVKSSVRFKVDSQFRELGIEMAFPQRDFNFKLKKPLEVKVLN